MKLEISLNDIEWNEEFTVKFNNEASKINATNNSCIFYYDEPRQYELTITQEESRKLHIWEKLLCCLFALVQGVIYILMFHTNEKWYNSISSHRIKSNMVIDLESDTRLIFKFKRGDVEDKSILECNHKEKILSNEVEYFPNMMEFKLAFFHHFRKISALFFYGYVLMMVIGISAYGSGNSGLAIFSFLLVSVFVVLHIFVYVRERKRLKSLE